MEYIRRTKEYDNLARKQRTVSFFKNNTLYLCVILAVLILIFSFGDTAVFSPSAGVIAAALLVVVGIITKLVLKPVFVSNTDKIVEMYYAEYDVPDDCQRIQYLSTSAKESLISANDELFCWVNEGNLCFVSEFFIRIENLWSYSPEYKELIKHDFGKLIIPLDEIECFKQEKRAWVLKLKDVDDAKGVKFKFKNGSVLRQLIPTLEEDFGKKDNTDEKEKNKIYKAKGKWFGIDPLKKAPTLSEEFLSEVTQTTASEKEETDKQADFPLSSDDEIIKALMEGDENKPKAPILELLNVENQTTEEKTKEKNMEGELEAELKSFYSNKEDK